MRDQIKPKLVEMYKSPEWETQVQNYVFSTNSITELLWAAKDLIQDGYVEQALRIAEIYSKHEDPKIDDEINKNVLDGKEEHAIFTVRGTVCWLVGGVLSTLKTQYYPRAIDLLERLAADDVAYVRIQVTYPLEGLMVNLKAVKNKDETVFDFKEKDRQRTLELFFRMLDANKKIPRVLERLAGVFAPLRFLTGDQAEYVLKTFLYEVSEKFRPDYVLHNIVPLLIYYAVFRKRVDVNFNDEKFKTLLREVIKTSTPRTKTTIIWHFWKTIENSPENYAALKVYMPLFFEGEFHSEPLGQYDFLVSKVLQINPQEGVKVFKHQINFIKGYLVSGKAKRQEGMPIWFYQVEDHLEQVAEHDPEFLVEALIVLAAIYRLGGYIGDTSRIFTTYKKAPSKSQELLKKQSLELYEGLKVYNPHLPPLEP
jgi:hypothetical protein